MLFKECVSNEDCIAFFKAKPEDTELIQTHPEKSSTTGREGSFAGLIWKILRPEDALSNTSRDRSRLSTVSWPLDFDLRFWGRGQDSQHSFCAALCFVRVAAIRELLQQSFREIRKTSGRCYREKQWPRPAHGRRVVIFISSSSHCHRCVAPRQAITIYASHNKVVLLWQRYAWNGELRRHLDDSVQRLKLGLDRNCLVAHDQQHLDLPRKASRCLQMVCQTFERTKVEWLI